MVAEASLPLLPGLILLLPSSASPCPKNPPHQAAVLLTTASSSAASAHTEIQRQRSLLPRFHECAFGQVPPVLQPTGLCS